MRFLSSFACACILAVPAYAMKPPREESPAPKELVEAIMADPNDEEIRSAIAAASAYPLGTNGNPIRVAGPEGERSYLARLRCTDGKPPSIGSRKDAGVGTFGSLVAAYDVDCGLAEPGKKRLVFDIYHEAYEVSTAPAGFTLTD